MRNEWYIPCPVLALFRRSEGSRLSLRASFPDTQSLCPRLHYWVNITEACSTDTMSQRGRESGQIEERKRYTHERRTRWWDVDRDDPVMVYFTEGLKTEPLWQCVVTCNVIRSACSPSPAHGKSILHCYFKLRLLHLVKLKCNNAIFSFSELDLMPVKWIKSDLVCLASHTELLSLVSISRYLSLYQQGRYHF